MSHLVIVGGSDAGISAALRAKELESTTQVTVIVEDAFPNYSICCRITKLMSVAVLEEAGNSHQ
jgi:flavin-dependent dehydrogenase